MRFLYATFLVAVALMSLAMLSTQVSAQGTYVCSFNLDKGCWVAEDKSSCAEGYFGVCEGDDVIECLSNTGKECVGGPPLAEKVSNLYNTALGIGAILALGIIVYAGVRYSASGGNKDAIDDAKKWISAAALGLILLFGSYLVLNTINPSLLTLVDPTTPRNEPQDFIPPELSLPAGGGAAVPEEGLNLASLPLFDSGRGALVICGNDNACESGEYGIIEVIGSQVKEINNLAGLRVGNNVSYVMLAGDLNKVVLYEDANKEGVKIIVEKQGTAYNVRYKCTAEVKTSRELEPDSGVAKIDCTGQIRILERGGVMGINLHNICIEDDDLDGSCSNNWGDDTSSMVVEGL